MNRFKRLWSVIRSRSGEITPVKAEGMTLVEVLASLTLTIFLLGMLAQFLKDGVGLWSKNDRAYRNQHQLKYVYQTLANDLEGVFTGRFLPDKPFQGEELRLVFWNESNDGLKQIGYRYDLETKAVRRWSGIWGGVPEESNLFSGVSEWRFEYYKPDKKNWVLEWNPSTDMELPSLVKITAKTDLGVLGPVVFPIKTCQYKE